VSPELLIMRGPRRGYARLSTPADEVTWARALVRPLIVWVVLAVSLTIAGTGHISTRSLAPMLLWWAIVPVAQLGIAFAVVRGPAVRSIGLARALDLFFMSHAPWSLWLLLVAAWAAFVDDVGRPVLPLAIVAVVPLAWTWLMTGAFFLEVLRLDLAAARRRVVAHQALTWGLLLSVWGTAVQVWPRMLGWLGR
jgi:hypothetical protein